MPGGSASAPLPFEVSVEPERFGLYMHPQSKITAKSRMKTTLNFMHNLLLLFYLKLCIVFNSLAVSLTYSLILALNFEKNGFTALSFNSAFCRK